VVISRHAWDALRDALYRLEAAAEDVAVDLTGGKATKRDYVEAIAHLTSAVRDLQSIAVEPHAVGGPPPAGG